jgi:hypothetical protein
MIKTPMPNAIKFSGWQSCKYNLPFLNPTAANATTLGKRGITIMCFLYR